MKKTLLHLLDTFGYLNTADLLNSLFHPKLIKVTLLLSTVFGTLASLFEEYLGMNIAVYIGLIVLIIFEFYTGIKASIRKGKKIESSRLPRIVIKVGVYTILLGLSNLFALHIGPTKVFNSEFNVYSWLYYIILNVVILQMFISVFENLSRLGFPEYNKLFRFLEKKLNKWLDTDIEETPIENHDKAES